VLLKLLEQFEQFVLLARDALREGVDAAEVEAEEEALEVETEDVIDDVGRG